MPGEYPESRLQGLRRHTHNKRVKYGREGGRVSGMSRREEALAPYLEVVREKGAYEALAVCAAGHWKRGYDACEKKWQRRWAKLGLPGRAVQDRGDAETH